MTTSNGPERDLIIFAADESLRQILPVDGLKVDRFPFTVGREPASGERVPAHEVDLALPDEPPYHLSRLHFTILRSEQGFLVSDTTSRLGTAVNGEVLGDHQRNARALLLPGDNDVVAGGSHSKFRFRLTVS